MIRRALPGISLLLIIGLNCTAATAQDQEASSSNAVDLRMVYERAKAFDAEFQAARFELEAAGKTVPLAKSAFLPQISLGAEAAINDAEDDGQGSFTSSILSLSISQTLFNRSSGKQIDQAKVGVRQAEAQFAAIGQTLILRVATAYFDVLRAQANLQFSQSELEAISRQREQAERRFDVGLVPITDVRAAQAQFDLAVAFEIAADNDLSTAREALLFVSGINPEILAPLAEDIPLIAPEPQNVDAWVDIAKEQNLELVIAQLSVQNSDLQIDIERADRYPEVNLRGTASSLASERQFVTEGGSTEVAIQLNLPIYTGGAIKAQVAQAKAQALASKQQLVSQERTTTQQTRDAYRNVLASISRVQALQQALVSTRQSAEATDAGFRAGTRTSVEVLEALRDTFSARSDFVGARYDYLVNTLSLRAAAGTLSEEDLFAINRFLGIPDNGDQ